MVNPNGKLIARSGIFKIGITNKWREKWNSGWGKGGSLMIMATEFFSAVVFESRFFKRKISSLRL